VDFLLPVRACQSQGTPRPATTRAVPRKRLGQAGQYNLATCRNRYLTRNRATPACLYLIDNISTISTMNHLDSNIQDYPDEVDETYTDSDAPVGPTDYRWRPVAAIAAAVFVLAVIATVLIVNGGDSASTTATVVPPTRTVIATPRPTTPPPTSSLPPETVTTVPSRPRAPTARPTAEPSPTPTAASPSTPSTPPAVDPHTFVYRVTGSKQLFDLVSIIYTDAQGLPHTDLNVSLPWSKTVVLTPGVQIKSVVATSLTGRLNCAITDAAGQTVVASTNNAIIATCTR
jgi:hypothetical protein